MLHLLNKTELEQSAVVANNRMNRSRNAKGINSYEKDIKLDPAEFLSLKLEEKMEVCWMDLCCGQAKALIQTASLLISLYDSQLCSFEGIDLTDYFDPVPESAVTSVVLKTVSAEDWIPQKEYDLITCVHGLHYVGDKLKVIALAAKSLKTDGVFVAHLDLNNLADVNGKDLKKVLLKHFRNKGIQYNSRTRILNISGRKELKFDFEYVGGDVNSGPNYTGQEAVTSYYRI
jgi:2-polyprenyl-3-methyl-5-hydroxy-6-metoxy-1,4-benzoquinol methylase